MERVFLLSLTSYALIGGAFTIGQAVSTEIGRYELWSRKKRFLISNTIGAVLVSLAIIFSILFSPSLATYPLIIFSLIACAKLTAKAANAHCGSVFQPTSEELRASYGSQFAVEDEEIKAILDDDFTKSLFSMEAVAPSESGVDPGALDEVSEAELKRAIEQFINKCKRRWARQHGNRHV